MSDLRDIRRLYDIREVFERAGIHMGRRKYIVCPLPHHQHKHNTPSFSVFTGSDGVQRFKCHGNCGAQGDVIDLAGYLWVMGYDGRNPEHVSRAVDALQMRHGISFPTSEIVRDPGLSPDKWKEYLPIGREARRYCRGRGLTDETIDRFNIGQDGYYITIPTFEGGRLKAIKKRAFRSRNLRFFCEEGSKASLFNYDEVKYCRGPVFYVKGEIPAMILHQMGYKACAPVMGEAHFDPSWLQVLAFADIIIVGDNDETGVREATDRAITFRGQLRYPPSDFKDLDEWILNDPEAEHEIAGWVNTWEYIW